MYVYACTYMSCILKTVIIPSTFTLYIHNTKFYYPLIKLERIVFGTRNKIFVCHSILTFSSIIDLKVFN